MSRQTKLSEATSKMMEIESIVSTPNFQKTELGIKRVTFLFNELQDLKFKNAMCGEKAMNDWLGKINRNIAGIFSN